MYVCNRAGTLALANIPIIWVFAARNDPLLWLTGEFARGRLGQAFTDNCAGWSYATYSQFHRWSARIATVLAIVHASGYSIVDTWQGRYLAAWEKEFWYTGALVCGTLLHPSSETDKRCAECDLHVDTCWIVHLHGAKALV